MRDSKLEQLPFKIKEAASKAISSLFRDKYKSKYENIFNGFKQKKRKFWLLFPPNEDLSPTRVPYEESSVYSKMNFYSPTNVEDFKGIKQCRSVILEPGQVLFVPKGWWHFVENLEIAISINIWIPLPSDDEKRIHEAITLALVTSLTSAMNIDEKRRLLNSIDVELPTVEASLKYVNHFVEIFNEVKATSNIDLSKPKPFEQNDMDKLKELKEPDFLDIITKQSKRFKVPDKTQENVDENKIHRNIMTAFTNPDVVELIKQKLLYK